MRIIARSRLGLGLGLLDESGELVDRHLANGLRRVVHAWHLADRRDVLRWARGLLAAIGMSENQAAKRVVETLIEVGDIAAVQVGGNSFLTLSEPRWILTGPSSAALLGLHEVPDDLKELEASRDDLILRVEVEAGTENAFQAAGMRQTRLEELIGPPPYARFMELRGLDLAGDIRLHDYWEQVETLADRTALPVSEDARIRILSGPAGGFFGSGSGVEPTGRWSDELRDGRWLGLRGGYGEAHWHPVLVLRAKGGTRVFDLYDWEELRWLTLARGVARSSREVVFRSAEEVRYTCPLPARLRSLMNLLGPPLGPGRWQVNADVGSPLAEAFDERSEVGV